MRSSSRYSKNMNPHVKFLAFEWIWGFDDRRSRSLPQFLRHGPDIRISPTVMFLILTLFFTTTVLHFFLFSFKRLSSSANWMNGRFLTILSSVIFPISVLIFYVIIYHQEAVTPTAAPETHTSPFQELMMLPELVTPKLRLSWRTCTHACPHGPSVWTGDICW